MQMAYLEMYFLVLLSLHAPFETWNRVNSRTQHLQDFGFGLGTFLTFY
jgi:hypothetical protein